MNEGKTHWDDCWKFHDYCKAQLRIKDLLAGINTLRAHNPWIKEVCRKIIARDQYILKGGE